MVVHGHTAGVSKCFVEFVGTFLLVLTICCNDGYGYPLFAGVSIGCVLMVEIYIFGKASGANFNPAVSVTLGLTKLMGGPGISLCTVLSYTVSQILGGVAAAFTYKAVFFHKEVPSLSHKGFHWWQCGLCEALYTCMLCFVVLNVAAARKYSIVGNDWYGLAIGFVVIAGAYAAGAVSGGCFNPAVALSLQSMHGRPREAFLDQLDVVPYVVCEIAGAVVAAFLYIQVRPADIEDPDIDPTRCIGPIFSKMTSEFLGTFALVLTVGLNILAESKAAAISITAVLVSGIYALGDVSGAHFNPAVTLACFVTRNVSFGLMVVYMIVQILAGVFAVFMCKLIYWNPKDELRGTLHLPSTPSKFAEEGWEDGFAEVVFTAVLCMTVLAAACDQRSKLSSLFGLAIGSCVLLGILAVGNVTGGLFNPAVSIGVASSAILNEDPDLPQIGKDSPAFFKDAWFYCGFQFAGALVAAIIMKVAYPQEATKAQEFAHVRDYVPLLG